MPKALKKHPVNNPKKTQKKSQGTKRREKSNIKEKALASSHNVKKIKSSASATEKPREYLLTGIEGFDKLFEKGIPKGASVLISGGAGSGKTIMCLQMILNAVKKGKNCLYMTFEESEERLREHMRDFGWKTDNMSSRLVIKRFSIFDIGRTLEAMMAKSQGELLIDVNPILLPKNFTPDIIIVDSLTAVASAFSGRESYRSYIEHLFRYFESLGVTSFLITETSQFPDVFSPTGVEEFLADGVIVLYNKRTGNIRESAIEVLKMRGAKHIKKVVAMRITSKKGMEVFPEQEVFGKTE